MEAELRREFGFGGGVGSSSLTHNTMTTSGGLPLTSSSSSSSTIPILAADITSAACALLCLAPDTWMAHTSAGDAAWRALLASSSSSSFNSSHAIGDHSHPRERDKGGGGEDHGPGASLQGSVGTSLRESIIKRRGEGWRYVLLFAVREERPFLLKLPAASV